MIKVITRGNYFIFSFDLHGSVSSCISNPGFHEVLVFPYNMFVCLMRKQSDWDLKTRREESADKANNDKRSATRNEITITNEPFTINLRINKNHLCHWGLLNRRVKRSDNLKKNNPITVEV